MPSMEIHHNQDARTGEIIRLNVFSEFLMCNM